LFLTEKLYREMTMSKISSGKNHPFVSTAKCCGLLFAAGMAVFSTAAVAGSHYDSSVEVATPKAQLKFQKINPAVSMAPAYGDMNKGGHGTFGKFPANFETPLHIHTAAYHGIVLKGVMKNPFKDQKTAPDLVAGSYWHVPAKSVHTTACVSDTPCEFYFYSRKKFDFIVVK